MGARASSIGHDSDPVSPEIEAALHLMFAPGVKFQVRKCGGKTVVKSDGSKQIRSLFAVLPNESSPRTLIPIQPNPCTRRALEEIRVFAPRARAAKFLLQGVAAVGVLPMFARMLEVSGNRGESLFDKVAQLTGERDVSYAVSFGTPSGYRKLTITAMSQSGEPLAFVKVPMTKAATARIEHEGETLKLLSRTLMSNHVPTVLFMGEWNEYTVLCISAGPAKASSVRFDGRHRSFLEHLWNVQSTFRDGAELVSEVTSRLSKDAADLDSVSVNVASQALESVRVRVKGVKIRCGLSHGDFAPWNLRNAESGLFAFDWEASEVDRPNLWDMAHYDTQLVTLLGQKSRYREITRGMTSACELRVLYLLQSIADASRESGIASKQVKDRVRLLMGALEN